MNEPKAMDKKQEREFVAVLASGAFILIGGCAVVGTGLGLGFGLAYRVFSTLAGT